MTRPKLTLAYAYSAGDACPWATGIAAQCLDHEYFPIVIKIDSTTRSDAKYFPGRNIMVVHDDGNAMRTVGLITHESAHCYLYHTEKVMCRGRSRCGTKGVHTESFYQLVRKYYQKMGVDIDTAIWVEGAYPYPKSWDRLAKERKYF